MADVRESKEAAQQALFDAITAEVGNVTKITSTAGRAVALKDLALAYRFASGGPQPGGSGDK